MSPSDLSLAGETAGRVSGLSGPSVGYSYRVGKKGLGGPLLYNEGSGVFRSDTQLTFRLTKASREIYG